MASRVEEDFGIDGARVRLLASRLERLAPAGRWWPYRDPFRIAVSAVLTQRTRWGGARRAMEGLERAGLLTPRALAGARRSVVETALRPAGFYRQKAHSLQGIAARVCDRFGGRFSRVLALGDPALRSELLSWPGVGEETADAILLFAAGRPAFVVDAYTVRLMRRFGAIRENSSPAYGAVAAAWAGEGAAQPVRSKRLHASIVELSKSNCRTLPDCPTCPLAAPCPKVGVAARVTRP